MNEEANLNIVKEDAEVVLIKFEALVEIMKLPENDMESLENLKNKVLEHLNQFIMAELSDYFTKKNYSKADLFRLIKELNKYDSAEKQLKYLNQKVDSEFWNRVEKMLNAEILNDIYSSFSKI